MSRKIEIFEPAMCCKFGLCGPSPDPVLVEIHETITRLQKENPDLTVQRHMFGQAVEPFTRTAVVMDLIQKKGLAVLPATVLDGQKVLAEGRYPSYDEFKQALEA